MMPHLFKWQIYINFLEFSILSLSFFFQHFSNSFSPSHVTPCYYYKSVFFCTAS